jgi:hypothetical protein
VSAAQSRLAIYLDPNVCGVAWSIEHLDGERWLESESGELGPELDTDADAQRVIGELWARMPEGYESTYRDGAIVVAALDVHLRRLLGSFGATL